LAPVAFILRVSGRDALRLRKPDTASYYLEHERRDLSSYYRQG
jgi:hypothetical protein